MRSALAIALFLLAVVALLSKAMLATVILAPLAWMATRWAQDGKDDLEGLMGLCVVACAVTFIGQLVAWLR